MGPLTFKADISPPVNAADRGARGDIALGGDRDRRLERHLRRRHREHANPDADQFIHAEQEPETEEGVSFTPAERE